MTARLLQPQQLRDGRIEAGIGIVGVDHLGQGRTTKVLQQQETGLQVARQHLRHAYAIGLQQVTYLQPALHILQPRRRVHHDA